MKKIFYGVLFGLILAIIMISAGANTKGAPVLTYVYSNSMEPVIKVNDAFLVWPDSRYQIGDIVMYRPVVLQAPYITHRIIGIGEKGFITKGDNSPYRDQESGEPEIVKDRIVGKVVTIKGQPLIIPGLGNAAAGLQLAIGSYSRYLSGAFLILGIVSVITGNRYSRRRPKPRRRLRLRHIYRWISIISAALVMLSIYIGAEVSQIKYLVSEYPGSMGDKVPVGKPGRLVMKIRNNGFVPVWSIPTGIAPLSIIDAPKHIWPGSAKTVILEVKPQYETGPHQGYVQVYNYPILLPRTWVVFLHRLHPVLAITAIGITVGLWFSVFFKLLDNIQGFHGWIPLVAIKNKIADRRFKRVKAKLIGRRRVR